MTSVKITCGLALSVGLFVGCGGGENPPSSETTSSESSSSVSTPKDSAETPATPEMAQGGKQVPPPPASIGNPEQFEMPQEGTPLWFLLQIRDLRTQPADRSASLADLKKYRHQRNEKIAEMAAQVISQTHSDPALIDAFNLAVQELMEARLQNALQGEENDIALLYENAESLKNREPDSVAALVASHVLVRFAHTNALRYAAQEPQWITEFSRKAREFAGRFPQERSKALPLLSAAATTAELHGMQEEAIACHTLLAEKYADTPQGKFSVGVLRRLNLEGEKLEFAGPTLEGGFINLEDYSDRVVLIVFWSSDDEDFLAQLPQLQTLHQKYNGFGFEIIGVCMDEEELALNTWIEKHDLPWRQIFFVNKEERRFRNPVAQYYGVRSLPTMWLVDHEGVVQDAKAEASSLEEPLRAHLLTLREEKTAVSE